MSSLHSYQSSVPGRTRLPFSLVLLAAAFLGTTGLAAAQSATAPSSSAPAQKKSPAHHAHPAENSAPVQQTALAAPAPNWPVNDSPNKASVTWDSHGLRIEAANASLHQILTDVSADTGAKVEGLGTDERIFGNYGPGAARDVLSQLLHGSSYNVLMIGDQGAGTPRQIVLSARHADRPERNSPNQANNPDAQPDDDTQEPVEVEEPPQQPLINRPNMMPEGSPAVPRTPQQVLQEMQRRQQQMQEQQQQQQQQPQ